MTDINRSSVSADGLSLSMCCERHSRVAGFSEMIINLQWDECFKGRSGRGSLKLITSIIN